MTGRLYWPSGLAYVHATSKSYVTVAAQAVETKNETRRKRSDKEIAIVGFKTLPPNLAPKLRRRNAQVRLRPAIDPVSFLKIVQMKR